MANKHGHTGFTRWLREMMDREGLRTQRGLADLLGVSPTSVNHWLSGEREPDDTSVAVIARGFSVSRTLVYEMLERADHVSADKYRDWTDLLDQLTDGDRDELMALARTFRQTRRERREASPR